LEDAQKAPSFVVVDNNSSRPVTRAMQGGEEEREAHFTVQTTTPQKRRVAEVTTEATEGGGRRIILQKFSCQEGGAPTSISVATTMQGAAAMVAALAAEAQNAEVELMAQMQHARVVHEDAERGATVMLAEVMSGERKLGVTALCHQLLDGDERAEALRIRGGAINNIGGNSATVADMNARTQRDLARLGGLLVKGLLCNIKSSGGTDGLLPLLLNKSRVLRGELENAVNAAGGANPLAHPLCVRLKEALVHCKTLGLRDTGRQLLSLITAAMGELGVTSSSLQEWFSEDSPLAAGESVKIICGK
jgi:hypothetical protein